MPPHALGLVGLVEAILGAEIVVEKEGPTSISKLKDGLKKAEVLKLHGRGLQQLQNVLSHCADGSHPYAGARACCARVSAVVGSRAGAKRAYAKTTRHQRHPKPPEVLAGGLRARARLEKRERGRALHLREQRERASLHEPSW